MKFRGSPYQAHLVSDPCATLVRRSKEAAVRSKTLVEAEDLHHGINRG